MRRGARYGQTGQRVVNDGVTGGGCDPACAVAEADGRRVVAGNDGCRDSGEVAVCQEDVDGKSGAPNLRMLGVVDMWESDAPCGERGPDAV